MIMFIMFAGVVILLLIGVSTAVSMGFISVATFFLVGGASADNMFLLPQRMFSQVSGITLMAIPFFLLMGNVMNRSGISKDLFAFARACLGHLNGGLGNAAIAACMVMSAMSGSAAAVAAGIGIIAINEMRASGYEENFSSAIIASSGALGPIIPPSITLILFASMVSGVSVGSLFAAGVIPGIIIGLLFMAYCSFSCKRRKYAVVERASLKERGIAFRKAIWALLTPAIVLGGMFGGLFTATEAAAVAAFYAFIIGFFVYRTLSVKDVPKILWDTAVASAKIYFVIATAAFFQYVLLYTHIPQQAVNFIISFCGSVTPVLIIIILLIVLMGCFMEGTAILMISIPIFVPLAEAYNYDIVQLATVMCIALAIGVITPPVGLNLYVMSGITGNKVMGIARESVPFVLVMIVVVLLVAFIPALSLTLAYL